MRPIYPSLGLSSALLLLLGGVSQAALSPTATLNFDPPVYDTTGLVVAGASWGIDLDQDGVIDEGARTGLEPNDGVILGITQPASPASPGIDQPWLFFGIKGVHFTSTPVTIVSDDGAGNVALNFSGWSVNWNNIDIALGDASWGSNPDGIALLTCDVDCGPGDPFTLSYTATVTDGPFMGVRYRLGFDGGALSAATLALSPSPTTLPGEDPGIVATGTIGVPEPGAIWLVTISVAGLLGLARRKSAGRRRRLAGPRPRLAWALADRCPRALDSPACTGATSGCL